ncbi:hypothetical protein J1614_007134 [Plenodomus biglobosus]|nr:hypothetical protein J1614_007134 [Plenodomus biglobosus]
MHLSAFTIALCVFSAADLVIARPTAGDLDAKAQQGKTTPDQIACAVPPAAGGEEAAAVEGIGEGAANEVEIESAFDTAVPVEGGDLKQDLVFTPSTVGKFEYEFQAVTADEVTVKENTAPAAPPAGFEAIEPTSYIVSLAKSKGAGLTLSKIDYIFDTAAAGLAGKDITTAQVGKLCVEAGGFVISESLGELEFEVEENEVTLNLNKNVTAEGEWGIFLPVAAGVAEGAVENEGAAQTEAGAEENAALEAAPESKTGHATMVAPEKVAMAHFKD